MKGYKIILEDKGQDFLAFETDKDGIVIQSLPYQTEYWQGALIPVPQQKIGDLCMIHHPKLNIEYGYLQYKVLDIQIIYH